MRASAPAKVEEGGGRNKRQRDSDNREMKKQADGKVNIPLVEIFRLHAWLDIIVPIGILHKGSPYLCVLVLK